jgi:hypothetical protein
MWIEKRFVPLLNPTENSPTNVGEISLPVLMNRVIRDLGSLYLLRSIIVSAPKNMTKKNKPISATRSGSTTGAAVST